MSTSSILRISFLHSSDTCPLTLVGKWIFFSIWAFNIFLILLSSKGIDAQTMMKRTHPIDQTSYIFGLYGFPFKISGAAYAALPQYVRDSTRRPVVGSVQYLSWFSRLVVIIWSISELRTSSNILTNSPCESEICDLDAIVFGQKQIFALHIAVNNVYWVAIWNSTADIAEEPFGVSILLRAVALYETQQIPIFCPVHEDENSCFEFEDGFDFNHRLVIKLPDDVQLSRHEFLDEIFRRFPFTDDFAGVTLFLTIRIGVFGKLNFSVRSFAEDPAEGVSLSPQIGFLASRPSISVILHIRAGVDHLCYQDL